MITTIPQLFRSCSQAATRVLTIASITAAVGAAATKPRYDRPRIPQQPSSSRPGRDGHTHSFHEAALEASNYARPIVGSTPSDQNLFSRLVFYELSL